MATLTITMTGAGTLSPASKTLSMGDLTKLQAALTYKLAQTGVSSPTTQDIFDLLVTVMFNSAVDYVKHSERDRVSSLVQDIALT
jgi:hypothetical protein